MVKTSFKVKPPPIGSQIGSALGKGLGEAIPKEVERYRLSQGLKDFAKNAQNLSPLEAAAQLGGIPGISPQMLQILPELLKRQQYAQALQQEQTAQPQSQQKPGQIGAGGNLIEKLPAVQPNEAGQPQANPQSPFREQVTSRPTWSQERVNQERAKVASEMPWLTIPEINQEVQQREQRYQSEPESYKRIDDERRVTSERLKSGLSSRLELLLQGTKADVIENLSGPQLNNLFRSAERDLVMNPNSSEEDVINYWANKGLDLTKAQKRLDVMANQGIVDRLTSPGSMEDNLKEFQKIFAETGNEENFANYLVDKFDLSREGAATIAYPISKRISDFTDTKKYKWNLDNIDKNSRAIAIDVEDMITPKDSVLAVARELALKNQFFDKQQFLDQLREDQDRIGLTPLQKREIAEGFGSSLPTWGDIFNLKWRVRK